jgi:PAS domain S-box-containing protein
MDRIQRTVLVVDDSPEDCETYRRYLLRAQEYNHKIVVASLGQEGLAQWQQHKPDAVLLDYRLPDMDGLEFLAALQTQRLQVTLPVIMVTGEGNEAIAVQAIKAGAQDYLVKGKITPESLQLAVNATIRSVELQTQLQQRIERERVIVQISQKVYQSLKLDDVLNTTVEEVRHFLQCDRVLVFHLESDGSGTVMAESVGAQWQSIIATKIYDPCLVEGYIEQYRQGFVTSKTNIYDGSIDPCHLEMLAQFQVRANLVVPILHEEQFWGLLIAHNCAAPRQWQPLETDLLQQLATQVSIAIRQAELYQQVQSELAERQRTEEILRDKEEKLWLALEAAEMTIRERKQAEATLQLSEQRYASLAEVSPVGIFRTDMWGECEYVNKRWCELAGLTFEAALGTGWASALHPDDRDRIFTEWDHATKLNIPFQSEYRFQTPDGIVSWVVGQAIPQKDTKGNIINYVGTITDITKRKQTEEALQQSEEFKNRVLESSSDCIKVLDLETRLLYINSGGMCLFEIDDLTRFLNSEWLCLWQDEYRQATAAAIIQAKAGKTAKFQGFCPTAKGTPKWWDVVVSPIHDSAGQVVQLLSVSRDITEQKQAETSLKEQTKLLEVILSSMGDGLVAANLQGEFTIFNEAAQRIFGPLSNQISPDEWAKTYGLYLPDQKTLFPNDEVPLRRALRGELVIDVEVFVRHEQALEGQWISASAYPLGDESHNVKGGLVVCRDITERKRSEMERDRILQLEQAARKEAERANRVKDEFLAVLSHELRSPLNPILGWAQLLQVRQFDAEQTAKALATIERNAKLQTELIDDLLDVAKILRGKLNLNVAPVNLKLIVEAALENVSTAAIAKSILVESILPQIGQVLGDDTRLQQIIGNLISNAIKFTPHGGHIDIRLQHVDNQAQFTVTDTGKGINSEFLPHIFEPFCQEDLSVSRKHGGLGLGLAIVYSLVELHGGTITATSPGEGQGSTFTVQLPLLNEDPQQTAQLSEQEPDLTGIRILTVDDEQDSLELVTILLIQYGAEVMAVNSAKDVLIAMESFQPDVLVSDIGMPEMDGYTLMRYIRTLPPQQGGQIPAIALTSYARQIDQQQALAAGFQRHVAKPIDPHRLAQAVILTLNKSLETVRNR